MKKLISDGFGIFLLAMTVLGLVTAVISCSPSVRGEMEYKMACEPITSFMQRCTYQDEVCYFHGTSNLSCFKR